MTKQYWTDKYLCKVTEETPAILRLQSQSWGKKQASQGFPKAYPYRV